MAVRDGGCYGHVDGPRFNTRAEIRGLAACGVTAVSQTAGPETVLCGEAELPYALLGFLTDYANGVKDEATPVETLIEMMAASTDAFAAVLRAALPRAAAPSPRRRASCTASTNDDPDRGLVEAGDAEVVVAERVAAGAADADADAVVALGGADLLGEFAQRRRAGIAALVGLFLLAEDDRREAVLALVGVLADEADALGAAAGVARDPDRVRAGEPAAAHALQADPRARRAGRAGRDAGSLTLRRNAWSAPRWTRSSTLTPVTRGGVPV